MKGKIILFVLLSLSLISSLAAQSKRDEGIELYRQGNYQQALNVLQEVVTADKQDKTAKMYLGAALYRSGQAKHSVGAFQKGYLAAKDLAESFDTPLEIVSKPRPSYTDDARTTNVQGTIGLAVEFLPDGSLGFIIPVRTLPGGLTQEAMMAAKRMRFKPAQKNGKPVTVVGIVEYSFSIY